MTDRIHALTVVLDHDIREDDIEPLLNAIQMMKFVLRVEPIVTTPSDLTARMRASRELHEKLFALLREEGSRGD